MPPRIVTQGDGEGGNTSFFVNDNLGDVVLGSSSLQECHCVQSPLARGCKMQTLCKHS